MSRLLVKSPRWNVDGDNDSDDMAYPSFVTRALLRFNREYAVLAADDVAVRAVEDWADDVAERFGTMHAGNDNDARAMDVGAYRSLVRFVRERLADRYPDVDDMFFHPELRRLVPLPTRPRPAADEPVDANVKAASVEAALEHVKEELHNAQAELAARDASLEDVAVAPPELPEHVKGLITHPRHVLPRLTDVAPNVIPVKAGSLVQVDAGSLVRDVDGHEFIARESVLINPSSTVLAAPVVSAAVGRMIREGGADPALFHHVAPPHSSPVLADEACITAANTTAPWVTAYTGGYVDATALGRLEDTCTTAIWNGNFTTYHAIDTATIPIHANGAWTTNGQLQVSTGTGALVVDDISTHGTSVIYGGPRPILNLEPIVPRRRHLTLEERRDALYQDHLAVYPPRSIPPSISVAPSPPPTPSIQYPAAWADEPLLETGADTLDACVICLERRVATCNVPCGHAITCVTCSHGENPNRPKTCHTCRAPLAMIIRLYPLK